MNIKMTLRALLAVALGAIAMIAPTDAGAVDSGRAGPPASAAERGRANFEGRTIDLQRGWGEARACHVGETFEITCFRSEAEMDRTLGLDDEARDDYPSAANGYASCGSWLRLYSWSYYGTPVLYLSVRGTWTTLSWFGFDNQTSSYRMGSCSATFRSGSYGAGSTYPGPTWAWARRTTMGWSWDNVLSSVWIY